MATVSYPHIEMDARGVPYLAGTQTKAVEVVLDKLAYDWSPDKIHEQHPHLSLAQIHAAFTYYYDNQTEIDAEIQDQLREYDEARALAGESEFRKKLRSLGLRP